jgi:tetratricopeptide (TPR) repeat protein
MQRFNARALFFICLLLLICLFSSACGGSAARQDRREERDPLLIRGDARKRAGDVDGAIDLYQEALSRKPQLAMAHLKLGLEFDNEKQDYLRAVYHYARYLELRPAAEKRDLIEGLIRSAHNSYLATLPNPPPGAIEQIALLQRENERLKRQVDQLADQLRQQAAAGTTRPAAVAPQTPPVRPVQVPPATAARPAPAPAPAAAPAPAVQAGRRYRVVSGDTLSRIAVKMYNDSSAWRKIYQANRDQLSAPESLRVGQELTIPP